MTLADALSDYGVVATVIALTVLALAWVQGRAARTQQPTDGLTVFPAVALGMAYQTTQLARFELYFPAVVCALALLFALACVEARRGPGPALRLVVQLAAAFVLVRAGFGFDRVFFPLAQEPLFLGSIAPLLSGLLILVLMNGFSYVHTLGGSVTTTAALIAAGVALLRGIYIGPQALALPAMLLGAAGGVAVYNFARKNSHTGHAGALLLGGLCAAVCLEPQMPAATLSLLALPPVALLLGLADGWRIMRLRAAGSVSGLGFWRGTGRFALYVGLACPMTPLLYLPAKFVTRFTSLDRNFRAYALCDRDMLRPVRLKTAIVAAAVFLGIFVALYGNSSGTLLAAQDATQTVPALLAEEANNEAMAVASLAVARNPYDPDLRFAAVHATLATGGPDAAQRALDALFAINLRSNPAFDPLRPERAPRWQETSRPFVYLDGRLLEARLALEAGHPLEAVAAFTLAQSFGRVIPASDAPVACRAYGAIGAWQTALPFCMGTDNLADEVPVDAMKAVCMALAKVGQWDRCLEMARGWQRRAPDAADAELWIGRAHLALGNVTDARTELRRAMMRDQPDAPWFLALALRDSEPAQAEQVALRTLQGSLYRTAAVALAISLAQDRLDALPPGDPGRATVETNLDAYHTAMERLMNQRLSASAQFAQEESGPRLLGLDPRPVTGGSRLYPGTVLWTLDSDLPPGGGRLTLNTDDPNQPWVRYDTRVLEVRWLEDLAPFGDFAWNPSDENVLPGWPDAYARARNLGSMRLSRRVLTEEGETVLEVAAANDNTVAIARSIYIPVEPGTRYVFGTRCRSVGARLVAGWEWYGGDDEPLATGNLFNQLELPEWKWRVRHLTSPENAQSLRLHAGIYEDAGSARFDRIQFFALSPRSFAGPDR